MNDPVRYRLDKWKRQLIDLSARNRLLNFKPTRVTTLRIVDELPSEVFRHLYLDNKAMRFLPQPAAGSTTAEETPDTPQPLDHAAAEFQHLNRATLAEQYKDAYLQTGLPEEKLDNTLLRIYQSSTSLFVEQGVNVLFLALGMIEWFEARDSDTRLQAPIILLPVQLARQTARSLFIIKATGDDPVLNPALVEKLRLDCRLALPKLPDTFEDFHPQAYFSAVQDAIATQKRWRVTNDIYMGLFTFQKFVMYKDLEVNEAHYLDHPIIQSLCAGKGERVGPLPEAIRDARLDEAMPPETTYQVLDADSSQQRAMLAAKANYDLVLEGPPGTGKSQTIANLIAEALATGKRVLFVSEKMAALDVVYGRLETLGLHDFCLNLHSNKTNKRTVIEELTRVLNSARLRDHGEDAQLDRLAVLREELNGYASDLHEPFGELAASPYRIFDELARLDAAALLNAEIAGLADCQRQTLERTLHDLNEHASLLEEIGDPLNHVWRGSELTGLTGADRDRIEETITEAIDSLKRLVEIATAFAAEIGAARPLTFGQAGALGDITHALTHSPVTSETILRDERWNTISADAQEQLEHGRRYVALKAEVLRHFKIELLIPGLSQFNELLQEDFTELLDRYSDYCRSWTRFITPQFWRDRQALRGYYRSDYQPANNDELLADLRIAHECRAKQLCLRDCDDVGRELFGNRWQREECDWDDLKRFAEWVIKVRRFIVEGALASRGIALAASGQLNDSDIQVGADEVRGALNEARQNVAKVMRLCAFAESGEAAFPAWQMAIILERLIELHNGMASLRLWTQYQASLKRCQAGIASQALKRFYELRIAAAELEPAFQRLFYRRWLDLVCAARPRLAQFRAQTHEKRIAEFKRLDLRAFELARQRVLHRLSSKRDRMIADSESADELIIVQRELRKKSRHIPLRQLLSRAPRAISVIKPCFMMSPLSVAQFLDPAIHRFDLVVFDEASQIPPEDALGAIVRGKQAVVVGDSKQLPPTSFFSAQIVAADEASQNEELTITDSVESILDEFASVGFARLRLRWHYRSRHESLITFSNRKFYDSELITFPGPATNVENGGVQFQWVGGIYEGKGTNSIEARAVADAVCDHIRKTPHLSLGVGTFNIKQQTLILDELDQRRRADPALEFFFAHRGEQQFFVKNLENIQGDDRDVILISVTYGPDADGRIRYNFGPINGPNGWRRLNVILTRAKQTLKIFTSLRGEQIDPSRAQNEGARLLREYLLFAERGILSAPVVDAEAVIESPFEQSVYQELTQRGLQLVPQVGQSGFRIDFGVLDETLPGRFIAGIECDGAAYHSAATARDRDRLRQQVLEGLGWRIHRIWSTDWYHDKDNQIARIIRLIEASREELRGAAQAHVAPPPVIASENEEANLTNGADQSTIERSIEEIDAAIPQGSEVSDVAAPSSQAEPADASLNAPVRLAKASRYQLTPVQVRGAPEEFYTATEAEISGVLRRIVDCEAPVHLDEATRRVAAHWQMARLGNRIRARVESAARQLEHSAAIRLDGNFLWKQGQPEAPVRSRPVGDYDFDAAQICPAEYAAAVTCVLRASGPRLTDELVTDVARLLGFERTGKKLTEQISAAIEEMVRRGNLRAVATGIQLAEIDTEEAARGRGDAETRR